MANFIPVRCSGNLSNLPVKDGQLLVDQHYGTIAVDNDKSRSMAKYVYGITKPISVNTWIHKDGYYYIDVTEVAKDSLPQGHTVVGASIVSGAAIAQTSIEGGIIKITTHDRTDGNILIFALAGSGYDNDSDVSGLIALYHMEDRTGGIVDSVSGNVMPVTNWSSESTSKYGTRSIFKPTIGYLSIPGEYTLNSFTIEWWQYDPSPKGDGGSILTDKNNTTITIPSIGADSDVYIWNEWKHYAISNKYDGPASVYINGQLIGHIDIDTPLEGPFTFYGAQAEDGSAKPCYIDELAIFNYARYIESFDVEEYPYTGANEAQIGVYSDITITGAVGSSISVEIPVTVSPEVVLEFDTSDLDKVLSDINISGNILTGIINSDVSGDFYITVGHPGSVSKHIRVKVNDGGLTSGIYYGYIMSDTLLSVKDITKSDISADSLTLIDIKESDIVVKNAPAGSFTVVLVPYESDVYAHKVGAFCNEMEFDENSGVRGTGANDHIIDIDGSLYRAYGEFNLISTTTYIKISDGYVPDITVEEANDAVYIDGDLYTAVDNMAVGADREWELTDDHTKEAFKVTGSGDADGVYIYDETTQAWSK